jgi:hypothetical protein
MGTKTPRLARASEEKNGEEGKENNGGGGDFICPLGARGDELKLGMARKQEQL